MKFLKGTTSFEFRFVYVMKKFALVPLVRKFSPKIPRIIYKMESAQEFPVPNSGTSGLHVCSQDVSMLLCGDQSYDFFTSVQDFFVFKKFE